MCRKANGTILANSIRVPTENIEPPLSSWPSYKRYKSSNVGHRTFCSNCGSSITWEREGSQKTCVWVGTLDEDVLIGKLVPGSAKKTEHGTERKLEGGFGTSLCAKVEPNEWFENAICGATDKIPGPKYLQEDTDGAPIKE
jgi:hypothetical protein